MFHNVLKQAGRGALTRVWRLEGSVVCYCPYVMHPYNPPRVKDNNSTSIMWKSHLQVKLYLNEYSNCVFSNLAHIAFKGQKSLLEHHLWQCRHLCQGWGAHVRVTSFWMNDGKFLQPIQDFFPFSKNIKDLLAYRQPTVGHTWPKIWYYFANTMNCKYDRLWTAKTNYGVLMVSNPHLWANCSSMWFLAR